MGSLGDRPHALVIPLPQQGHWHPMKTMLRQLVDANISFTVWSTPKRIAELRALENRGNFESVDAVQLEEVFTEPRKEKVFLTAVATERMHAEFLAKPSLMMNLLAHKVAAQRPSFIIADMFLYWTQDLADELGIPRYTFFTSPTTSAILTLQMPALIAERRDLKSPDHRKTESAHRKSDASHRKSDSGTYPGLECFRAGELLEGICNMEDTYKAHSKCLLKAAGIVINSFSSFETDEVNALRKQLEGAIGHAKIPDIFLVGPMLHLPTYSNDHSEEATLEPDNSACLRFLDSQAPTSVLYICFGTLYELEQSAITEIARGLELCGVSFLWVLPHAQEAPCSVNQLLPNGFSTRTEQKGLVWTGWAPQKDILEHPSVGGFLTHCGWNSLLETIRAGVPIIPWPSQAEQSMNARFMATVAKVGVEIVKTAEGEFVGEEIAKAICLLMYSAQGKAQRQRMQSLRRAAKASVEIGGSSHRDLQAFLHKVSHPCKYELNKF